MIEGKIIIINKLGLHARAAAKFVSTATAYSSDIRAGINGKLVDGKSIMAIMMLAASKGTELELAISGDDETLAFEALENLINDRFGEDE